MSTPERYALESRSETLDVRSYADSHHEGEEDRLEIGSGPAAEVVTGAEVVTVGGRLRERAEHGRMNQMAGMRTTVRGRLSSQYFSDTTLLAGAMADTHAGGSLLLAGMSDDLIVGAGARLTGPLDLWLSGINMVELKGAAATADGVLLETYGLLFDSEEGTSTHMCGTAQMTASTAQVSMASGAFQILRTSVGVRNLNPGPATEVAVTPPPAAPPPAPPAAGAAGAAKMVGKASGSAASGGGMGADIVRLARFGDHIEDLSDLARVAEDAADVAQAGEDVAGMRHLNNAERLEELRTMTGAADGAQDASRFSGLQTSTVHVSDDMMTVNQMYVSQDDLSVVQTSTVVVGDDLVVSSRMSVSQDDLLRWTEEDIARLFEENYGDALPGGRQNAGEGDYDYYMRTPGGSQSPDDADKIESGPGRGLTSREEPDRTTGVPAGEDDPRWADMWNHWRGEDRRRYGPVDRDGTRILVEGDEDFTDVLPPSSWAGDGTGLDSNSSVYEVVRGRGFTWNRQWQVWGDEIFTSGFDRVFDNDLYDLAKVSDVSDLEDASDANAPARWFGTYDFVGSWEPESPYDYPVELGWGRGVQSHYDYVRPVDGPDDLPVRRELGLDADELAAGRRASAGAPDLADPDVRRLGDDPPPAPGPGSGSNPSQPSAPDDPPLSPWEEAADDVRKKHNLSEDFDFEAAWARLDRERAEGRRGEQGGSYWVNISARETQEDVRDITFAMVEPYADLLDLEPEVLRGMDPVEVNQHLRLKIAQATEAGDLDAARTLTGTLELLEVEQQRLMEPGLSAIDALWQKGAIPLDPRIDADELKETLRRKITDLQQQFEQSLLQQEPGVPTSPEQEAEWARLSQEMTAYEAALTAVDKGWDPVDELQGHLAMITQAAQGQQPGQIESFGKVLDELETMMDGLKRADPPLPPARPVPSPAGGMSGAPGGSSPTPSLPRLDPDTDSARWVDADGAADGADALRGVEGAEGNVKFAEPGLDAGGGTVRGKVGAATDAALEDILPDDLVATRSPGSGDAVGDAADGRHGRPVDPEQVEDLRVRLLQPEEDDVRRATELAALELDAAAADGGLDGASSSSFYDGDGRTAASGGGEASDAAEDVGFRFDPQRSPSEDGGEEAREFVVLPPPPDETPDETTLAPAVPGAPAPGSSSPPPPTEAEPESIEDLWRSMIDARENADMLNQSPNDDWLKAHPSYKKDSGLHFFAHESLKDTFFDLRDQMQALLLPYADDLGMTPDEIRQLESTRGRHYTFNSRDKFVELIDLAQASGDVDKADALRGTLANFDEFAKAEIQKALDYAEQLQTWGGVPLPAHLDKQAMLDEIQRLTDLATEKIQTLNPLESMDEVQQAIADAGLYAVAQKKIEAGLDPMPYILERYYASTLVRHSREGGGSDQVVRGIARMMDNPTFWSGVPGPPPRGGFLDELDELRRMQEVYEGDGLRLSADHLQRSSEDVTDLANERYREILALHRPGVEPPSAALTPDEVRSELLTLRNELFREGKLHEAMEVQAALDALDTEIAAKINNDLQAARSFAESPPSSLPGSSPTPQARPKKKKSVRFGGYSGVVHDFADPTDVFRGHFESEDLPDLVGEGRRRVPRMSPEERGRWVTTFEDGLTYQYDSVHDAKKHFGYKKERFDRAGWNEWKREYNVLDRRAWSDWMDSFPDEVGIEDFREATKPGTGPSRKRAKEMGEVLSIDEINRTWGIGEHAEESRRKRSTGWFSRFLGGRSSDAPPPAGVRKPAKGTPEYQRYKEAKDAQRLENLRELGLIPPAPAGPQQQPAPSSAFRMQVDPGATQRAVNGHSPDPLPPGGSYYRELQDSGEGLCGMHALNALCGGPVIGGDEYKRLVVDEMLTRLGLPLDDPLRGQFMDDFATDPAISMDVMVKLANEGRVDPSVSRATMETGVSIPDAAASPQAYREMRARMNSYPGDRLMVGYSGGHGSDAHMVTLRRGTDGSWQVLNSLSASTHKPQRFDNLTDALASLRLGGTSDGLNIIHLKPEFSFKV